MQAERHIDAVRSFRFLYILLLQVFYERNKEVELRGEGVMF